MLAVLSGANLIYGAGLLETGISYSHSQLVLDNETFKMIRRLMEGIPVNDESLDINSIHNVGPGGTYMGEEMTLKYLRGYHSTSSIFDRQNRGNWMLTKGGKNSFEAAREIANDIIKSHRPSVELTESVKSDLHRIVVEAEEEVAAYPDVLV